jgi:hypothetical protein
VSLGQGSRAWRSVARRGGCGYPERTQVGRSLASANYEFRNDRFYPRIGRGALLIEELRQRVSFHLPIGEPFLMIPAESVSDRKAAPGVVTAVFVATTFIASALLFVVSRCSRACLALDRCF